MPHLYLYSSFGAGDNLKQRGHTDFLGPILCLSSDVLWAFKWYCSLSAPSHPLTEIFSGHIYILSSGILTHKTVIPISNKNICPQEQDNLLSEQAQGLKGELFPCWLWPQDVKLALVFSGSHLHSTRLHCKGFFFFFSCLYQRPCFKRKDFVAVFLMDSARCMWSLWSSKLFQVSQTLCSCQDPSKRILAALAQTPVAPQFFWKSNLHS